MDKGTENSMIGAVHYALREDHGDAFSADKSIRYGTSPANIVWTFNIRSLIFIKVIVLMHRELKVCGLN